MNIIPVRFQAYRDLERWHLQNHKHDFQVYRKAKQKNIGFVTEYITYCLRQNIAIKDIVRSLKDNGMHSYIKSCLKESDVRKKWMIALVVAPKFCLNYLKKHLASNQISTYQISNNRILHKSFETFVKETERFPEAYSSLLDRISSPTSQ